MQESPTEPCAWDAACQSQAMDCCSTDLECQTKMPAIFPCQLTIFSRLIAQDGNRFAAVGHQRSSLIECLLDVMIDAQELLWLRSHLR